MESSRTDVAAVNHESASDWVDALWKRRETILSQAPADNSEIKESEDFYFDGNCMVPMQSWNARMELEHWNRYLEFRYLSESKTVLDIACGEGYGTDLLSSIACKAIGIDLSVKNINHAKKKYACGKSNLEYIIADACNLPLEPNSAEVIYSFETIEHLENIPAFLLGFSRVISDNGVGIISTPRPNINPLSKKPFNPFHINELSAYEFENHLRRNFQFVGIAGQSRDFPYEIHREFNADTDAYTIGIVSKKENIVSDIIRKLPDRKTIAIREQLFERHFNQLKNFSKPLRALFVPLKNADCDNPADRRRVLFPAEYLRRYGAEIAVVSKEDVLNIQSKVIYSQNRNYEFWLNNIEKLKKNGRKLVFSFSDALNLSSLSKAHYFDAFSGLRNNQRISETNKYFKLFIDQCCSHVFAGSDEQKKLISDISPTVSATVLYDPIDIETYDVTLVRTKQPKVNEKFTLIWEGFIDNVPYLLVCAEALKRLSQKIPLRVIIVTSQTRRNAFLGTNDNQELAKKILGEIAEFHLWNSATISNLMARSDAALAPLFIDCPFAAAKPPNKAIIYNYMKLPVIASPTAGYKSYIKEGLNGFIATNETDWERHVEYLHMNPDIRHKMGEFGHNKAKDNFSVEAIGQQMLDVFQKLA